MSRFHECDDWDSNYSYLWDSRVRRIIEGKRGQRMLRELIDALLALPERRLIAGAIAKPSGEVCAVGALAKYKGVDLADWDDGTADDDTTARLGERLGLTYTLAFEIGFKNDVESRERGWHVPLRHVTLDVPVLTEPDPRERFYGYGHNARPRTAIHVMIPDYDRAYLHGVTPEERWQRIYDWACSHVRWNLPAVAA